jgi:branched-chain amino acid transport system permease protein
LVITVVSGVALFRMDRSRMGRTIKAVADNDPLCESIGVNTWGHKAAAHVIGSFFVGIAGVLFASYNGFAVPTDYSGVFMFKIVAAAIIGGVRTFAGPILGLVVITLLQEGFRDLQDWLPFAYGIAIVGILLFLPHGIESRLPWISASFRKVFAKASKNLPKPQQRF